MTTRGFSGRRPSDDVARRLPPGQYQTTDFPVLAKRPTPRVSSVFLRADVGAHDAGQHVDIGLTAADRYQAQRSDSIASPPGATRIELAIEALEDGEVSPYFHDVARAGDTVEIRGPIGGHFVWRAGDDGRSPSRPELAGHDRLARLLDPEGGPGFSR